MDASPTNERTRIVLCTLLSNVEMDIGPNHVGAAHVKTAHKLIANMDILHLHRSVSALVHFVSIAECRLKVNFILHEAQSPTSG